jgi:glycosyltransferase involved in cell wall biosynthesis
MPSVSIIIPAFRSRWLGQCIGSAIAQSFDDFELIIGDDSVDESVRNVVEQYSDRRLKYYKNPTRGQPGSNRDFLISLAKGEYIKFLFDDDYLYPNSVELLMTIARQSGCGLAFHGRHVVDESGSIIGTAIFDISGERKKINKSILSKIGAMFKLNNPNIGRSKRSQQCAILDKALFFDRMIGHSQNMIGEPSNILLHSATLKAMKSPFAIAGQRMRFLTDMALYTNIIAQGHSIAGCTDIHSAFRQHEEQTSKYGSPAYSAGLFEWEFIARWAVDEGLLTFEQFEHVHKWRVESYKREVANYPELAGFIGLKNDKSQSILLDGTFLDILMKSHEMIDQRKLASVNVRSC